MYWSDLIVKQEQRKDLLRQVEDRQLVRQALAARPRGAWQGYELARRYARYALTSLAAVGFGISMN